MMPDHRLAIHQLPTTTRRRLKEFIAGKGSLPVLARGIGCRNETALIIALTLLSGSGWAGMSWWISRGFGDFESSQLIHSMGDSAIHVLWLLMIIGGAVGGYRLHCLRRDRPLPPGEYLLPTVLLHIKEDEILIWDFKASVEVLVETSSIQYRIAVIPEQGPSTIFVCQTYEEATETTRLIDKARAQVRKVLMAGDENLIEELDPFHDLRKSGWDLPEGTGKSHLETLSAPARFPIPVTFVMTFCLLLPLILARNVMSDLLSYSRLQANPTAARMKMYMENGYLFRGDVGKVILVAQMDEAVEAWNFSKLIELSTRSGDPTGTADLKRRAGLIARKVGDTFEKEIKQPEARWVLSTLVHRACLDRKRKILVRFGPVDLSRMAEADAITQRIGLEQFGASIIPPRVYFESKASLELQDWILADLTLFIERLRLNQILSVRREDADSSEDGSGATKPEQAAGIISVDLAVSSKDFYRLDRSGGSTILQGLVLGVRTHWVIPGDTQSLDITTTIESPPSPSLESQTAEGAYGEIAKLTIDLLPGALEAQIKK